MVRCAADLDHEQVESYVHAALESGFKGILVDGTISSEMGRLIGPEATTPARGFVSWLRKTFGSELLIVAAGGVSEPAGALALYKAGADLIEIDEGLVYSGPGLAKRTNDAFHYLSGQSAINEKDRLRIGEQSWIWTFLMGAGMLIGSVIALLIAFTTVLLPYDESFLGMSAVQIAGVNPRLLAFMTHDRIALTGAMVAIGVLYVGISLGGVRSGWHWAHRSILASALTGFASFFLFLGYGYLDTFHAFVTAILFQFLLLAIHSRLGPTRFAAAPPIHSDWRWRMSLWGQLLLIVHACLLFTAGVVIATVGVTTVFVAEDLAFMQTTAEALAAENPRLIPLIAHDRATLGGMLLSSSIAFLLPALWGFRNGSGWLWWTMAIAGLSAYGAGIGVHYQVGYVDWHHLMPAYVGLVTFVLGLALSRPYLCDTGKEAERQWQKSGR